jgi:hypothetical protein
MQKSATKIGPKCPIFVGLASARMYKDCEEQDDEEEIPLTSLRFSFVRGS